MCFAALSRKWGCYTREAEIRRQRAEDIGYGIIDTWKDPRDVAEEEALTTLEGVNTRRTTRLNPGATSNPNQAPSTTTTTVTNAQLQAMIHQGVNAALVARDANQTGDDSHTSGTGVRRTECWFERMEMVFRISNCLAENQVKFATCILFAGALTWWNSYVRIVGNDAAYVMTWIELKKKMADKYCPRSKMKKIKTEFWNLEVQGTDVTRYNQRFQELALMYVQTCPEESDRVKRYIGGLPDSIHGSVAASKPKTMQEATEMATGLMDKKIRTYAERQAANKRKQDVARAYAAGSGNRQQSSTNANVANNQRGNGAGQKVTCYECGAQGHFKRYCPKLKNNNNNSGNQVGTGNAQARVYVVGNARTNPDANTVTDHDYVVELADGRIVGVNTGRETLIFHGDGSNQEHEAQLNIISCAKTQKYMLKGCQVFLAHVTTKEAEGKSEKKRLENVPIVRDFFEVFPEDLPGLPPTRQVVFQIDLIPGAVPVARAPYRLASPEMKELKEREPLRVRALVMTIGLDLPKQILNAQTEVRKVENIKKE
nr:hypothetical protein [Tanacetum cinerariifolium]